MCDKSCVQEVYFELCLGCDFKCSFQVYRSMMGMFALTSSKVTHNSISSPAIYDSHGDSKR